MNRGKFREYLSSFDDRLILCYATFYRLCKMKVCIMLYGRIDVSSLISKHISLIMKRPECYYVCTDCGEITPGVVRADRDLCHYEATR